MRIELDPCPFCGGKAKLIHANHPSYTQHSDGWYIACKCGASLGFHGNDTEYNTYGSFPNEFYAIYSWNTRAYTRNEITLSGMFLDGLSIDDLRVFGKTLDEIRQMMKRDAERERTCNQCKRFWTGAEMLCSNCAHQLNDATSNYCPNCGAKVVK